MQYPKISERFAAALIDWLLYTTFCLGFYLVWVQFSFGSTTMLRIVGFIAILLDVGIMVGYKVLFEGGKLQATPGKLVFGLKVVDPSGARAPWNRVLLRTAPW